MAGVVGIGKIRPANGFDGPQRIGSDRRVAGDRSQRHVDVNAGGRGIVVVEGVVEAARTVDEVIAGAPVEFPRPYLQRYSNP